MRSANKTALKITLLILLCFPLFPSITFVESHDYYKIKLRIQVTNTAQLNNSKINENVDRMNMIMAQCRVRFNIIQIFPGILGNADNFTNRAQLRGIMQSFLMTPPFFGSGAGITITDGIDMNNNTLGVTITGDPTSVIVDDGTTGETWAHEMVHGMGNKHNGKDTDGDGLDDSFDPDGDGQYDTPQDKMNLMWPYENSNTGSALSEVQCDKIREAAKKIGIGSLNADQAAAAGTTTIQKIFNFFADTVDEISTTNYTGLLYGTVSSFKPYLNTTIEWVIDRIFLPDEPVDFYLDLAMDADDNSTSGNAGFNMTGLDLNLEIWIYGDDIYSADKYSYLTDYINPENSGDIPATITILPLNESSTTFYDDVPINETQAATLISVELHTDHLGVRNASYPAVMRYYDYPTDSEDLMNITMNSVPPQTPLLTSSTLKPVVGDTVSISGSYFAPNSAISIALGDISLLSVVSDENGNFSAQISIPVVVPGAYFLEVYDENGGLAILIFDVMSPPTSSISPGETSSQTGSSSSAPSTDEKSSSGSNGLDFSFLLYFALIIPIFTVRSIRKIK